MQFWQERELALNSTPTEEQLKLERFHQVAVIGLGFGVYFINHRALSKLNFFRHRPFLPQFIAVIPAMGAMYIEGLRMRWKTLKNLRF
jgi:hypothetical protein